MWPAFNGKINQKEDTILGIGSKSKFQNFGNSEFCMPIEHAMVIDSEQMEKKEMSPAVVFTIYVGNI